MIKPDILYPSVTWRLKTACGNMFVVFARDPETKQLIYIHTHFGKSGGCASATMADMNIMFRWVVGLPRNEQIALVNEMKGTTCQYGRDSCKLILMEQVYHELLEKEV